MGHEAFGVDLDALGQAERGVRDAVDALGEHGISSYVAEDGRGLEQGITDLTSDIGGEALPAALDQFAEKWDWGVRQLVDDGVAAADALRDTRSTYEKAEAGAIDAFQYALHAAMGNPLEDSTAWQDKSAGELAGELMPDLVDQQESLGGVDINGDGRIGQQGEQG